MKARSKKTKIAIFHCGFVYSGGGERIVLEQAHNLKKRGYEVEVYAPTVDRKECFPDFLQEIEVKTFLPSFSEKLPFRDAFRMMASSLMAPLLSFRFRDVDVFLGANQPGVWIAYCVSKVLGKPYLIYMNQPNRLVYPRPVDLETGWQTRRDYYLLAQVIKLAKPLVAWTDRISITSSVAAFVNGGYMAEAIERIYGCSVVLCPGAAYPQPRSKLRLQPNSPFRGNLRIGRKKIKKPYLLITNRHEPQKKFEFVIEAMVQVVKKFPEVNLVIPGPFTSYTPRLQRQVKELSLEKNVLFIGQISEERLQLLYRDAAVYCYPSPDEDFGLGPVEAGVWGVPTVAWGYGGPTVTVEHGVTGYLAEPYEVDDYAKGIIILLEDRKERSRRGLNAWKRVKEKFSWDQHLDTIEEQIKKVLSQ